MRLLDKKGRLFGKINVIDFLICVLIIVIVPGFFQIYKILGKTPGRVPFKWTKVEAITFTLPEIATLFKPGDVAYDEYGNVDAKLVKVISVDDERMRRYMNSERIDKKNLPYAYSIPVLIELELLCTRGPSKTERWFYRRNPLAASLDPRYTFMFSTNDYSIHCFVIKTGE